MLAELGRSPSTPSGPAVAPEGRAREGAGVLGDYRIIREVGRGGMGVVYEAMRVSLGRRVALKVLPFSSAMVPRHLLRFRAEAQAAAHLHHGNIVPVFSVGSDRDLLFYAMQFIEGRSLAEILHGLRSGAGGKPIEPGCGLLDGPGPDGRPAEVQEGRHPDPATTASSVWNGRSP
jgi:serine/threonine protein kinase